MHEKLSIIIPVHNEAETIKENVLNLEDYLTKKHQPYEIVLSEDGSTDGTDKILESMASSHIVCLHDDRRLGKGAAINKAFSQCSGSYVFIMDADFPAGLECIHEMTRLLSDYDIVLGSRMVSGSEVKRSDQRGLLSIGYNLLVRALFNTGIKDHQCGVKAVRSSALREIAPAISARDFFWDTEMIVRARQMDFRIAELAIKWKDRPSGKSKLFLYKDIFGIGTSMIKFWLKVFVFRE